MARRSTFSGGIFPDPHHSAMQSPIGYMPAPHRIYLPAPEADPLPIGTPILRGQIIGCDTSGIPLHSCVSGTIAEITEIAGGPHYLVENDGEYQTHPDCKPFSRPLSQASSEEIVEFLRASGIQDVPENGRALPERISAFRDKIDLLIINGCESQPYMTAVSRLLYERPDHVVNGAKILLKALGSRQAVITLCENNLDAANRIEGLVAGSNKMFRVRIMTAKYPQEEPHQLIYALTEKEVPTDCALETSGHMVVRADTCAAVFHAFATGLPQMECLLTVSGSKIKTRRNLFVPIGTPIKDVLSYCDGLKGNDSQLILDGPLNGSLPEDPALPITKQTTALLAMARKSLRHSLCIRCGRCYEVCPMHLMPAHLAAAAQKNDTSRCLQYSIHSCIECGCCAYVCPGNVPLPALIRSGKAAIIDASEKVSDESAAEDIPIISEEAPAPEEESAADEPAEPIADNPPADPGAPMEQNNPEEKRLIISRKIQELKQRRSADTESVPEEPEEMNNPEEESESEQ